MAARKPTTKAPEGYATTGLPSRKVVQAVLKDINRIRKAEGWPPVRALLRGWRGDADGCPVARTIVLGSGAKDVGVCPDSLRVDYRVRPTPRHIAAFIKDFDAGCYPGLRAPHA